MKSDQNIPDMTEMALRLTELEELLLLAIVSLDDQAYGMAIQERLAKAGRPVAVGGLYASLNRLENRGAIVVSQRSEAIAVAGGRSKTYYRVTRAGQSTLSDAEGVRCRLRECAASCDARPQHGANKTAVAVSSLREKKPSPSPVPVNPSSPQRGQEAQAHPIQRSAYLDYYGS